MALTELPSFDNTDRENELAQRLQVGSTATESIDLNNIFGEGLTTSGSFNAEGIKSTSFCKLLRAIPIPALLVDKSHTIIFCNDACARITGIMRSWREQNFLPSFLARKALVAGTR